MGGSDCPDRHGRRRRRDVEKCIFKKDGGPTNPRHQEKGQGEGEILETVDMTFSLYFATGRGEPTTRWSANEPTTPRRSRRRRNFGNSGHGIPNFSPLEEEPIRPASRRRNASDVIQADNTFVWQRFSYQPTFAGCGILQNESTSLGARTQACK